MSPIDEALDEHYEYVAEALGWGAVVPLLGAGVNVCEPDRRAWVPGENLPSGRELSQHLAHKYRYPDKDLDDLARVSQYAQAKRGDGTLYDQLHDVFTSKYGYTAVHRFLAELPRRMREQGAERRHQLIVTTNYDDAMEQALQEAGEEFDLVWYSASGRRAGLAGKFMHKPPDGEPRVIERPNEYRLSVEDRTVVLKIHGAAIRNERPQDSYVITEDHYIEFLTHTTLHELIPKTLLATLLNGHFLFLGYSLRDWNLRVILHQIWAQREQSRDSWAIQHEVREIDKVLWEARDVLLHEVPLDRYVVELGERMAGQASGRAAS